MSDIEMLALLDSYADTAYNLGSVKVSKDDMLAIHAYVDVKMAEIEDVKRRCGAALSLMERKEECIVAEAIKEFAERLKDEFDKYDVELFCQTIIDNLAREMVGETDA